MCAVPEAMFRCALAQQRTDSFLEAHKQASREFRKVSASSLSLVARRYSKGDLKTQNEEPHVRDVLDERQVRPTRSPPRAGGWVQTILQNALIYSPFRRDWTAPGNTSVSLRVALGTSRASLRVATR